MDTNLYKPVAIISMNEFWNKKIDTISQNTNTVSTVFEYSDFGKNDSYIDNGGDCLFDY